MTKKQILSALVLSTLALAQAGFASADEVTPVDSSEPSTEIIAPVEPSDPVETPTEPTHPVETPTEPTAPTEPVEPANPTPPVEPIDPSTPPTTEEPAKPSPDPVVPTPSDGDDSSNPGTSAPAPEPKPGDPAPVPAEDPISSKPIPEPVVTFNPFETPGGQTVVGTQNSQVVIQNNDGSTQTVKAEEVGGTTNADGTVTLKASSGEVKTLPQTGEEAGGLFSLLGTVILTSLGYLKKKKII